MRMGLPRDLQVIGYKYKMQQLPTDAPARILSVTNFANRVRLKRSVVQPPNRQRQ